jgi:hypothetical protein
MATKRSSNSSEGNLTLFNSLVSGALPAGTTARKPADAVPNAPKKEERYEWGNSWIDPLNDFLFTEGL